MTSTTTDQINGFSGSLALKQPVRLASTGPLPLEGLAPIDGTAPLEGDRVLAKDQADARQNGIYIASSGIWERAADLDATGKVVKGTQVWVTDGATLAGYLWLVTAANPISLGVTPLTWQAGSFYQAAAAMAVGILGAAVKATPVAADEFGYVDNASGMLRQFSWTQMLAAIGGSYVSKAGDTVTGDLTIAKATPRLILDKQGDTQSAMVKGTRNGLARWQLDFGSNSAETGSEEGSNFTLFAYNDAGGSHLQPMRIRRTDGEARFLTIELEEGRLRFPGTQNSSSDPNTLDDYEEGSWTPTLTFGGAAVGMVTTAQTLGRYTKIGNQVAVYFRHQLSAKGSSTGAAVVGGLPFASNNFTGGPPYSIATGQIDAATMASLVAGFDMAIGAGNSTIALRNRSTTGHSGSMTEGHFTNTSGFGGSGVYMV